LHARKFNVLNVTICYTLSHSIVECKQHLMPGHIFHTDKAGLSTCAADRRSGRASAVRAIVFGGSSSCHACESRDLARSFVACPWTPACAPFSRGRRFNAIVPQRD
jgi:hypothetical protein